jgi:hypothetical protein
MRTTTLSQDNIAKKIIKMSFISLPVELLLLVIASLPTRDIVVLGLTCKSLQSIAEDERAKRQDINRLLSRYVDHPENFRRLMRDTGGIIVGDFARAFFTGEDTPRTLELLFGNHNLKWCLDSWASLLGMHATDSIKSTYVPLYERYRSPPAEVSFSMVQSFSILKSTPKGNEDKKIIMRSYEMIGTSGKSSFLRLQFLRCRSTIRHKCSLLPQAWLFLTIPDLSRELNYISWNTAFCAHLSVLSTDGRSIPYHVSCQQ